MLAALLIGDDGQFSVPVDTDVKRSRRVVNRGVIAQSRAPAGFHPQPKETVLRCGETKEFGARSVGYCELLDVRASRFVQDTTHAENSNHFGNVCQRISAEQRTVCSPLLLTVLYGGSFREDDRQIHAFAAAHDRECDGFAGFRGLEEGEEFNGRVNLGPVDPDDDVSRDGNC